MIFDPFYTSNFTYMLPVGIPGCQESVVCIRSFVPSHIHVPTLNSKEKNDNTKTHPKYSITQRLRTNFRRSVEVATATQLVWLTGLRAPNLPISNNSSVIKRTLVYFQKAELSVFFLSLLLS